MTDTHKPSSPRKRKRRSKYNNNNASTYAFLDVTASIVSSAFAASRLTEIQQLTNSVVLKKDDTATTSSSSFSSFATATSTANIPLDETPYRSGGGKTATRHLRRRATSHQSRKRHRYPQGNVIQSQAPKTRKGRRNKRQILQAPHMQWADESTSISSFIQTPEQQLQHWIPTHVWHAKRFHMESLFGWKVPLLHTQRGAKAALRLVREEYCVIQDTTWKTRTVEWTTNNDFGDDDTKDCLSSIIPKFCTKDNTQTIQSGQGMLHMPNQYPMGTLGPIEWMVLPIDKNTEMNTYDNPAQQQQQDDAITTTTTRKIRLSVHPALLQTLWDLLQQFLPEKTVHPSCRCSTLATLTLRGKSSHECLMKTLQKIAALDHDPNIPDNMPHFDTICLDDLKVTQRNNSLTHESGSSQSETLIVTRVAPRSPEQSCNWGVCGYNLTGQPQWMARLFHELVITGQACPIGLVEESQLHLECDPPLLHFPRDYVDIPCGQDYWKADDEGSDWFVVRQWQEGGLGRIRPASSLPSVSFMGLFSLPMNESSSGNSNNDKDDQSKAPLSTVVIRGAFGQPILDLLQHATPVPQKTTEAPEESDTNKPVKRRRPSRNPTYAVRLPIAPTTWRAQFQAQCATLRASMTLPALLLAHVRVEGSGTVTPGMTLHFYENTSWEPRILGYVLSGTASHHRGRSHGMAALGASAFLQALESTSAMASNPHQAFVSVPNIQGTRVTSLLVQAGQGKDACSVSLT